MDKQENIKVVLFDFDGTLVFLPIDYDRMRSKLKELFSQFGIESDFYPLIDSISKALAELQRNGATKTCVEGVKRKAYAIIDYEELKAVEGAKLVKGTKDIFAFLKGKSINIAIVSRNGKKCINKAISKFNLPKPNLIVSREDSTKIKPAPEHLMVALEKLKLKPNRAIIVGDSFHDIDAGRSLGIPTVLVTHGRSEQEQLDGDYSIPDLLGVFNVLE